MNTRRDYMSIPVEDLSIAEMTDAIGVPKIAEILGTSARVIYSIRHTNRCGVERYMQILKAFKDDESAHRNFLHTKAHIQAKGKPGKEPQRAAA